MQGRLGKLLLVWLVGAAFLWLVAPLSAQSSLIDAVGRTKFVSVPMSDMGPLLTGFTVEVGQPVVIQVQNVGQENHCLVFDIPPSARLPELGLPDSTIPPATNCAPGLSAQQGLPTPTGTLQLVDLEGLTTALQCGTLNEAGQPTGFWAYQLPEPIPPGGKATLCFVVTEAGQYPYYDPGTPTLQGTLIVTESNLPPATGGAVNQPYPDPATATPTPLGYPGTAASATPVVINVVQVTATPEPQPTVIVIQPTPTVVIQQPTVVVVVEPPPTATPTPTPTPTPIVMEPVVIVVTATPEVQPDILPITGADDGDAFASLAPFWLMLGGWTVGLGLVVSRILRRS